MYRAQLALCLLLIASPTFAAPYLPDVQAPQEVKPAPPAPPSPYLEVRGLLMVTLPVVRERIGLDGAKPISEEALRAGIERLLEFYRSEGYVLVKIRHEPRGNGWILYVDEGFLNSILISGLGWYATYLVRNTILPFDVFNAKRLEEQLGRWVEKKANYDITYELHVQEKPSALPLESTVGMIRRLMPTSKFFRSLQASGLTTLHIYFEPNGKKRYGEYVMDYSLLLGANARGVLAFPSLLSGDDRLELGAVLGANGYDSLTTSDTNGYYAGGGSVEWFTPPLGGEEWRLSIRSDAEYRSDQRPDLPLDRLNLLTMNEALNIRFEGSRRHKGTLYGAYNFQKEVSTESVPGAPFVPPIRQFHAGVAGAQWTSHFGELHPRWELNHRLDLDGWASFREEGDRAYSLGMKYRNTFPSLMADLFLGLNGRLLEGDVAYFEEESLHHLGSRAGFDRQFYLRRGLVQTTELFLNLQQRKLQASLYNDFGFFGRLDPLTGEQDPFWTNALGPMFYLTIYDYMEFRLGYAWGVPKDGPHTHEFYFGIEKVL